MNEYRGFKIGDRVEISWHFPITGTITQLFPKRTGGMCEPDIIIATVNNCEFDLVTLIAKCEIKKLPKYSVGDVVRLTSPVSIKTEIVTVSSVEGNLYCFHERGNNTYSECFIEPFDGFRVGDTVFTVKRGKGKVVEESAHILKSHDIRPFVVRFDGSERHRFPKLTNIIPTESLYKEALNKTGYAFKIDVAVVAHSAKFKVGDSVYYRGLRLIIESIWISIDNGPMYLIRPNGYACSVQESDLRLWKETKIKAILDDDTKNMIDTPCELSVFFDKFNVKHVGKNTIGDDVFVLTSKRFNTVRILFGIKGDDWV